MDMEWYMILALIGTGIAAGFINTTAGGGSMLTIPLLMFMGLPANIANGTNRIAILLQNVIAVKTFKQKNVLDFKTDYRLAVPAIIGSIIGALFAVEIDVELLKKIIAGLMVVLLLVVVLKPEVWIKDRVGKVDPKPTVLQYIIFFGIGLFGGFIQMGVGFFLLAGLVLGCGHNLVRANAIKVFIVLIYTVFSIGIFIFHKQVDIVAGLILAAGNMLGAWLGVNFTVKGGAKYVRYVLILAMIIVILNLFGVFS
ncbi:sulfite exporter TauE/SafE family protein [Draconibacterium halophilum]|uniref:Probable membrane transporter protein n=1 Tax=Draconibacterium halophilum TaxID=2706887 RepID=A0A6C0RDG9_9BACT|nr:sulfite exporter TauE/SafE family protein [Draconibacterium halophilum]QIA08698.1 sulfite exporter TauE/SafE family protein [Draconibacterium halophilum]